MSVSEREIIRKETKHYFKNNCEFDGKMNRYCLMIYTPDDEKSYYLILSTHNGYAFEYYQRFPKENYLLSQKKCPGLPKTSCINLRDIYEEIPPGFCTTVVPDDEYKKIVRKFKEFQSSKPDNLYGKISEHI